MGSSPLKTAISKEVDLVFRAKFPKTREFWAELGRLFVALAGNCTRDELHALRREFPIAFEFVEEYL